MAWPPVGLLVLLELDRRYRLARSAVVCKDRLPIPRGMRRRAADRHRMGMRAIRYDRFRVNRRTLDSPAVRIDPSNDGDPVRGASPLAAR
jgi:hypothetical protein